MAQLTPAPDYKCCGTIAPEAARFSVGGKTYHVHRHVNEKGEAARRFKNNWQLSMDGVPLGKIVAPSRDHVAKHFETLYESAVAQDEEPKFQRIVKEFFERNQKKLNQHTP